MDTAEFFRTLVGVIFIYLFGVWVGYTIGIPETINDGMVIVKSITLDNGVPRYTSKDIEFTSSDSTIRVGDTLFLTKVAK